MISTTIIIEDKEYNVKHSDNEIISINDKSVDQCDIDSLKKVYDRLFPENK